MEILVPQPPAAPGIDGPPVAPLIPPARPGKDKALSELAVFLGMTGDTVIATFVLWLGFWLQCRRGVFETHGAPYSAVAWGSCVEYIGFGVVTLLGCFIYQGIYRRAMLLNGREVAARIVRTSVAWLVLFAGFPLIFRSELAVSRAFLALVAAAVAISVLAWRRIFHHILGSAAVACHLRQRVVLVGWTPEAGRLASGVWKHETDPYEIVGYVDFHSDHPLPNAELPTVPYLGDFHELTQILAAERVDIALLADVNTKGSTILELVTLCEKELVQFKIIPSYFPILVSGLHVEMVSGTPLLGVERLPLNRLHNRFLKRTLDIVGSLIGLALSAPIILVFGAIVYLESPGPIFYRQRRLGRKGKLFDMIKIRSMRIDAEKAGKVGWTIKDDPRRLKIGTKMRKWNVDEVPQFWNVLKGEMSLVGPRPERPELIADFKHEIAHYNARHFIKPGLTGWAQVNGLRGDTDLTERVRHDLHYIEHWNLWLDLRAMILTFFKRQGAC